MMADVLITLPDDTERSLQERIKEALVDLILGGNHTPESPLPSGRSLARQLGVAKNTVVFAYQDLVADGLVVSRERKGYFISPHVDIGRVKEPISALPTNGRPSLVWDDRIRLKGLNGPVIERPENWADYPFPFIYGQVDPQLFPLAQWRECSRMALNRKTIDAWTSDVYGADFPNLLHQIKTRLLPRRGIDADEEQILVTLGAQNAIYLIARLLTDKNSTIGIEEPGYPNAWNTFNLTAGKILPLAVDQDGLVVDSNIGNCDLVFTTPSHHFPSTVTMSADRRLSLIEKANNSDVLIIEDDYECENNYVGQVSPALKSYDTEGRVIHVGSLSKTLFPGLRLGFMVADREIIRQARALRRIILGHPPTSTQHVTAIFLGLGYHDALIRKLQREYKQRWTAMGEALDRHLPGMSRMPTFGGSSYWVEGPQGLNADKLAILAREKGVLIESAAPCFHRQNPPENYFRLGFSSIGTSKIEPGIRILSEIIRGLS